MAKKDWIGTGADKLTFGERLGDLIDSRGINQSQLAEETGVNQSALSDYINKNKAPTCATIIALAQYFSVSTDYLLGLTGDPAPARSAVDDLGLSPKAIAWIESLEKKAPSTDHDNRLFVLNFLLENNDFRLFFYNLCEYFYACRAECLYDELWDHAFPEKYLETFGLTPDAWADFRKKLPKVLDVRFIPNEIKDYLLATDELMNSMSEANSHIVNVLTEIENFSVSDAIEYRISKYSRNLLEMIKQYALAEANIYAQSESIVKLIATAYKEGETDNGID